LAIPAALKRWRQSEKRRLKNKATKAEVKTYSKKVLAAVEGKKKDEAVVELKKVISLYDKAARKGIIKSNNAARSKSRLTAKVNALK
jgi:small subunit ribosomal protein S20